MDLENLGQGLKMIESDLHELQRSLLCGESQCRIRENIEMSGIDTKIQHIIPLTSKLVDLIEDTVRFREVIQKKSSRILFFEREMKLFAKEVEDKEATIKQLKSSLNRVNADLGHAKFELKNGILKHSVSTGVQTKRLVREPERQIRNYNSKI